MPDEVEEEGGRKFEQRDRSSHRDDRRQAGRDREKESYRDRDSLGDRKRKHGDGVSREHDRSGGAQLMVEHDRDSSDDERRWKSRREKDSPVQDDRRDSRRKHERDRDSRSDQKQKQGEGRGRDDEQSEGRRSKYEDDHESSGNRRRRSSRREKDDGSIEEDEREARPSSRKHERDRHQDRYIMDEDERDRRDRHKRREGDHHIRNGESSDHRVSRELDEELVLPANGDSKRKEESGRDDYKRKTREGADENGVKNAAAAKESKPSNDSNEEKLKGRSGGVYIPPFKLAQMMKDIQDKSSVEYQRMTWDALRKSINGLVNKVNASNIKNILPELFSENLIRGRGLFARSCMKSQMASPPFTHVFAGLVAVVNTKFPELGELLLKRIILQFRRALRRNDKPVLLAAAKFIAHLVNQQVAHEVVALEVLMVLLENPTDDSVEVAVGFVKECGAILQDLAPQGLHSIFERFRGILHEGEIDKRVQFMIEGLFAIRKANFQGHQAILPELDLVEREDQFTHEMSLSDDLNAEMALDIFKPDPNFPENEKKYEDIKRDILGEESDNDGDEGDRDSDASSEEDDDEEDEAEMQMMKIRDETETDLVNLRRTIYLTIMSSVDFEEAGHKLLKIKLEQGQEMELCVMLLECCSQERTYLRYYGLLGQRFCMINKIYQENFDDCFVKQYSMIHRLETNKLRNVAKFFAHLLGTDALPWNVLAYIRLTEEDTTSSSRIFIKILFQELSEHLGLRTLNERLNDSMRQESFDGIFPKDNPKNTRFAINFFTSIGLGGITDNLREYLKNMPRLIMQQQKPVVSETEETESSETEESDSSSSDSDSESSSSESESEGGSASESESMSDDRKRRVKRR